MGKGNILRILPLALTSHALGSRSVRMTEGEGLVTAIGPAKARALIRTQEHRQECRRHKEKQSALSNQRSAKRSTQQSALSNQLKQKHRQERSEENTSELQSHSFIS